MKASHKDTIDTQREILAHNEFLKNMGCSEAPSGQPSLLEKFHQFLH